MQSATATDVTEVTVVMPGTYLTSAFALIRGGAASGNRTPDLLITRRPDHAYYGVSQRQQLQISHLWVHQRHRSTSVRTTFDSTPPRGAATFRSGRGRSGHRRLGQLH